MRVEAVRLSGFRSIDTLTLDSCGGFNVLIGKNNAGKSNILLAIDAFFSVLRSSDVVVLNPEFPTTLDFRSGCPTITLGVQFALSSDERNALSQDIATELPQLKNAVDALEHDLTLCVTVAAQADPGNGIRSFAFIRSISLRSDIANGHGTERTILEIPDDAAIEMAINSRAGQRKEMESKTLTDLSDRLGRFDDDDWQRAKLEMRPGRLLSFIGFRSAARYISAETEKRVVEFVHNLGSREAVIDGVKALATALSDEVKSTRSIPLKNSVRTFSGDHTGIPVYAMSLLERLSGIRVLYLKERRLPIGPKEAGQLLELKISRGGVERLRKIQGTVSSLLGIDIDAFRGQSAPSSTEPGAELDVDSFLVQVNGAGVREALRVILDYEFERPSILLVEEPEIHLHPALETSMMRYLKARGDECQIFLTTHSTNFLDTAEMRNVYLVSKDNATRVQRVDASEAERTIPRELGIRLSSLFMFDRLIFVEGPSDEGVIREIAETLHANLSRAGVGFVSMGGVRNLGYFAAEATLDFLTRRQIRLWFMIDRDERDEAEIQRIAARLGERARLFVLQKRELENYLAVPRALAQFIRVKHLLGGANNEAPSEEQVEVALNACADRLRDVAIERRVSREACAPLYADRRAIQGGNGPLAERIKGQLTILAERVAKAEGELEALIQRETDAVTARWTSKWDLVPGDLLLDGACAEFGVRFHKEQDSIRLASMLQAEEIARDLKAFVNEISG